MRHSNAQRAFITWRPAMAKGRSGAAGILLALFLLAVLAGCGGGTQARARYSGPYDLYILNQPPAEMGGGGGTLTGVDLMNGGIDVAAASLGTIPNWMEVSGGQGYVVNSGDNSLQIVNLATGAALGTINIGPGTNPWRVAVGPAGKLYVSELLTDRVAVVEGGAVTGRISVGKAPQGLALANGKLYVTCTGFDFGTFTYGPASVSVIDAATDAVLTSIPVGTNASDIALAPDGMLHVVCTGDFASVHGSVYVIEPATDTVADTIAVGGYPGSIDIAANGRAYVITTSFTVPAQRGLIIYDAATHEIIRSGDNPLPVAGATNPFAVAVGPDGRVYVCDFNLTGAGGLYAMDPTAQNPEFSLLGMVGTAPAFIAPR